MAAGDSWGSLFAKKKWSVRNQIGYLPHPLQMIISHHFSHHFPSTQTEPRLAPDEQTQRCGKKDQHEDMRRLTARPAFMSAIQNQPRKTVESTPGLGRPAESLTFRGFVMCRSSQKHEKLKIMVANNSHFPNRLCVNLQKFNQHHLLVVVIQVWKLLQTCDPFSVLVMSDAYMTCLPTQPT